MEKQKLESPLPHTCCTAEEVLFMRSHSVAAITLVILGFSASLFGPQPATAAAEPQEIRSIEFDDYFDVDLDGALPFPPGAGTALLLPTGTDTKARLVPMGGTVPEDAEVIELADPINASFDARVKHSRLVVLERGMLMLRSIGSTQTSESFDWRSLAIGSPQGVAVDPESGSIFVLDAAGRRIVRVDPGPGGDLDATTAARAGRVDELPLPDGVGSVRGLAFDAARKRLYVLSPKSKALYEIGWEGQLLDVRPLTAPEWRQPLGLVVAPSADRTDPAEQTSLFLASASATGAVVTEWSLESARISAAAASERAALIRTIDTSRFSPPSPDPAGIAWDPTEDRLLVTDSEVNEMWIFTGVNFFETTRFGSLLRSRSTMSFSDEPTGIAIDRPGNRVFISDDTGTDRIYTVELGGDGRFDTGDDSVFWFDTKAYGSNDPEGVAFGNNTLYWVDGVNSEVYWMVASDGDFDGRRDSVGHFDTSILGVTDPEGIEWNPANGNLFIVGEPDHTVAEVTPTGALVRNIDISEAKAKKPAGLAIAPRTQGSGWSLFVTDRGVDNDSDPNENDGKVYELAISGGVIAQCGNGVRESGEQCDGGDLGGASCSDQGCSSGTPTCSSSCKLSYSGCSACSVCGNGIQEIGEDCDGSDLDGGTCQNQGFYCGSGVSCRSDCTYNTSSCVAGACGDDLVQAACGELCDGSQLGGETCRSLGWGSGNLGCQSNCAELDESECSVCDNDGVCEAGENCGNCPGDCTGGGPACGNHICEIDSGEDCRSCPSDCNGEQSKRKSKRYCCGDGDGEGPVSCGDARCAASGNSCEAAPVPSWCCGNGICEIEEDTLNCALDCGA
jgi:DNA-binding beta-propeller fold protein YncE